MNRKWCRERINYWKWKAQKRKARWCCSKWSDVSVAICWGVLWMVKQVWVCKGGSWSHCSLNCNSVDQTIQTKKGPKMDLLRFAVWSASHCPLNSDGWGDLCLCLLFSQRSVLADSPEAAAGLSVPSYCVAHWVHGYVIWQRTMGYCFFMWSNGEKMCP